MQVHQRPPLVVTQSGNGEERTAQIDRILNRMDRLRHHSEHMISEVAEVTREMKLLSDKRIPAASASTRPTH
jgi:hypothetical protein